MKYRAEIDGLRAFAVVSVVIYHAFPDILRGGFIGVDVFFVISGFLITRIILDEMGDGSFTFSGFFGRRVRRIFPALILVMTASLFFGWFVLLADQYAQLGKHIAGGAAFVVNFLLVAESGYFDTAADTKPMLHLWSLAVEEQFYIVWPLMLWVAWRWRANVLPLILGVALVSFALNLAFIDSHPEKTFFWPIGRFWELLSGSLLAWIMLNRPLVLAHFDPSKGSANSHFANTLSLAGVALLFGGVFGIHSDLNFPGGWALIPVMGAVCIIAAGPRAVLIRHIFMNPVAIWFGLISYPLYLWHWPILSFLRIYTGDDPSLFLVSAAVVLSILLAWFTYRLVEKPIRTPGRSSAKVTCLALMMALVGGVGLWISKSDGFDERILRDGLTHRDVAEFAKANRGLGAHCTTTAALDNPTCATNENPTVLLWGDSYAMHLAQALQQSPTKSGFRQQTMSSCRPVLGFAVQNNRRNPAWADECITQNQRTLDWLRTQPDITYVILASPFTFDEEAFADGAVFKMTDDYFLAQMRKTIEELIRIGKKPVLIAPPPWSGSDTGACWRANFIKGSEGECDFTPDQTTDAVYSLLESLSGEIAIIKLRDLICRDGTCAATQSGVSLFRDAGHLSKRGSAALGQTHDLMGLVIKRADAFTSSITTPN